MFARPEFWDTSKRVRMLMSQFVEPNGRPRWLWDSEECVFFVIMPVAQMEKKGHHAVEIRWDSSQKPKVLELLGHFGRDVEL